MIHDKQRFKVEELDQVVAGLRKKWRRLQLLQWTAYVLVIVSTCVGFVALAMLFLHLNGPTLTNGRELLLHELLFWGAPFVLLFLVLTLVPLARSFARRGTREKVFFAINLLEGLRDELLPWSKVKLTMDLRRYDLAGKRLWAGLSIAGNLKVKYSDKWLHLDVVLADGTRLRLVRQARIKAKVDQARYRRRLFLKVLPRAEMYDLERMGQDTNAARHILIQTMQQRFHNRPEAFHARAGYAMGELKIKVVQEDSYILAEEVVAMVGAVLLFLSRHRRPANRLGPPW